MTSPISSTSQMAILSENGRARVLSFEDAHKYQYPPNALVFDAVRNQYQDPSRHPAILSLRELPLSPQAKRIWAQFISAPNCVLGASILSERLGKTISSTAVRNAVHQIRHKINTVRSGVAIETCSVVETGLFGEGPSYVLRPNGRTCIAIVFVSVRE